MKDSLTKSFRPRARMLLQLGDQLIKNENIAIVELVKNSYDADASICKVSCKWINEDRGEIVIEDDGIGMTPDIVSNVWLEPGADFKDQLIKKGKQAVFDFMVTQPKRTPIGEKGVGRFGVHKLGNVIELVSKSPDSEKEVAISIDWNKFSSERYLDEATFSVVERHPEVFTSGKTGTRITVKELRKKWDKRTYQDLGKSLMSLSSPFKSHDDFSVELNLDLKDKKKQIEWQATEVSPEEIQKAALWVLDCVIEGSAITEFSLKFKPWKTMGLESKEITLSDLSKTGRQHLKRKVGRREDPIDLGRHNIGKVRIQAYLFDLDEKVLKLSPLLPDNVKSFLSQNGGIRVYRDNLRVYDYGEPGNDWLDLDKKRINDPSKQIGNRNILGSVMLDRRLSTSLVEKTNREGFVDGDAYEDFKDALGYIMYQLALARNEDKADIRKSESPKKKNEPVIHDITEIKDKIHDKLAGADIDGKDNFLSDIDNDLSRIQDQYIKTNEILIKTSNMGLSFGVVVHEVDKRIDELQNLVNNKDVDIQRIRDLVNGIAKLVDGYSALAANDKKKTSLKKSIDISLSNIEFRLKAHKVQIMKAYEAKSDVDVLHSMNSIVGMLLNLYDNSIYWLNAYHIGEPKIYLDIRDYGDGQAGIIVADNGKGFDIAFDKAVEPFISHKPIGGIGLGLHIVNEVMNAGKGSVILRDYEEVDGLPEEFADGAIIELIFKVKGSGS